MFPSMLPVTGLKAGFTFHITIWKFKYGDCSDIYKCKHNISRISALANENTCPPSSSKWHYKIHGRNVAFQTRNQLPFACYVQVGHTQLIFSIIWHKRWNHFSQFSNQDVRHAGWYRPETCIVTHLILYFYKFKLQETSYGCLAIIYGKW